MENVVGGAVLQITADGSQATAEMGKIAGAAERMERSTVRAAGSAAASLGGIGEGAGKSTGQVEAASKRFVASVEKEIAALTLSRAEYRKWEAQAKGISENVYGPLVDRLSAARTANERLAASTAATATGTNAAAAGFQRLTVSAGQTRAAFAQLPAQFTDIFTSLAGGQSPLLVLIQQGGQIKDSFGGVGNALRAVASTLTPFRLAVGATVGVVATLTTAFLKGSAEASAFRRAIELSGNAAGTSLDRLRTQAIAVSNAVGTQGKAAEVLAQLAGSGRVAAGALGLAAEAAIRLERVGGPAATATADAFAALGRSPTEAALRLNESTRFLTVSVLEQIRALEQQGNTAEAARVAQTAYAETVIQRTKNLESQLGLLQRGWKSVGDAARGAWDFMLNVGRESTVEDRLNEVRAQLQRNEARGFGNTVLRGIGSPNDGLRAQVESLEFERQETLRIAETQRATAALTEEWNKAREANKAYTDLALTGTERLNQKLEEYRRNVAKENEGRASAGLPQISSEQIKRTEAAIRAQFTTVSQTRDVYSQLRQRITEATAAAQQEGEQTGKLTPIQRLRLDIYSKLGGEYARLTAAQKIELAASLNNARAIEKANEARASETKFLKESVAERTRYLAALDGSVASQQREVDQIREQIIGLTAGKDALEAYRLTKLEDAEAELLRKEAIERGIDGDSAAADRYQREAANLRNIIALRRQLGGLETVKAGNEAADAAAKALTTAYEREYDRITDGLTDALIRGGKSFADYLKGLFRTLVFRPIIEPLIRPVAGILAGTGSTGALASGSDALGLANAVSKLGQIPTLFSNGLSTITGGLQTGILRLGDVLATSQSGLANTIGGFLQTNYATLGAVGSALGAFGLGRAAGQLIGGGFGFGNSGNSTINLGGAAGAAIGSIFPGIGTAIGAALGSALGGVVNRLFGRRLADSGLEGTLGADGGFRGNAFQFFEGGLFRSDKTERTELDPQVRSLLGDGVQLLKDTTAAYADALGLPADAIRSFSQDIRLSFKDLTEEEIGALVEDSIGKFGAALVKPLAQQLGPFTKAGEDTAGTLARLAESIGAVNPVLRELGQRVFAVGLQGADAASQLLDAFGGASNFASLSSAYYDKFFTEQERAARGTEILTEQFAAYGVALPKTRDAFRALVDAQDLTTDGGRKAFAALLGVAGAFDEILTVTEGAAGGINALAQALAEFTTSLEETIDATRLRTLTPAGRVAELRRREGSLFAELATTTDPASVAEKLQGTILDRIREEAAISEELRRAQIAGLQEQIGALGRLRDIAGDLSRTTAELSFSDLSPLNFQDQLNAAAALFESTADAAQRGDVTAAGQVAGALQAYLQEAREFFGSDTRFAAIYDQAVTRANALAGQGLALEGPQTDLQRQLDLLQTVQDTSQQELEALLSLQAALRERETVAAQSAADQTAALRAQIAQQQTIIEQQQAQIAQAAAIAERQIEQGDTLNALVGQLAGNSRQAIDAGIEP
jgi:phage-related minor tail protein